MVKFLKKSQKVDHYQRHEPYLLDNEYEYEYE